MEFLLRLGGRLASRYALLVALLVLLGAGFAYVAGLDADSREELLYRVQELLPIFMFLTLGVLLFSGYPVAFILGGLALLFGVLGFFLGAFKLVQFFNFVPRIWGQAAENLVLVAIPTFIFMGVMMERSGIAQDLLYCVQVLLKRVPGALALGVTIMGTILAAMTGIIGASVTMMTALALPTMMKQGYSHALACGTIAAAGTLGILIPPSIMLIVYAAASGVSIVRLYAGALFPGLVLAGLYLVYIIARSILQPSIAPRIADHEVGDYSFGQLIWMLATSFLPLAVLILCVLGAILFGFATPSEAAAVGALGGLGLAVAYRALTWQRLKESVYLTVRTSAMVCWLFVGSWTFSSVFSYLGGEQIITEFVTGLDISPLMFLILAQIIIFLLGWPLEWSEIIIIFVPIFLPLLPHFGIDPLFFGILVALNLQTSFLTPPMAMSAYYLKGIAPPHVQLVQIFRGCLPYLALVFLSMVVLYVFPDIVFWLPSVFYGR